MPVYLKVLRNEYFDSVTLMSVAAKVKEETGAELVVMLMATAMNKTMLVERGFDSTELRAASANDCVIGVTTKVPSPSIVAQLENALKGGGKQERKGQGISPATISSALRQFDANLVVISTPGEYAAREAELALRQGLNVMIFSDNVSVPEEVRLKALAKEKGLLLMGPDCGTAIINGVGLGFANRVRAGNIGLVAASGTGLQEVSVLIHRLGGGISQAIGVGGRDLSGDVGGLMMLAGIRALAEDAATEVVVLLSKPPAREVQGAILEALVGVEKPVVVCFLDGEPVDNPEARWHFVATLEGAAKVALGLAGARAQGEGVDNSLFAALAREEGRKLMPTQRFIRGLYCGGTLCAEALMLSRARVQPVFSNVAKRDNEKLLNPLVSSGHCFIDLGDDIFTQGRPHPMIDPSIRLERILQEASDPEVAVLILDFVLGYGSHADPVGVTLPTLHIAREIAAQSGRHLAVVGYVCGTDLDKQGYDAQCKKLESAGVLTATSTAQAAELACKIVAGGV